MWEGPIFAHKNNPSKLSLLDATIDIQGCGLGHFQCINVPASNPYLSGSCWFSLDYCSIVNDSIHRRMPFSILIVQHLARSFYALFRRLMQFSTLYDDRISKSPLNIYILH